MSPYLLIGLGVLAVSNAILPIQSLLYMLPSVVIHQKPSFYFLNIMLIRI